MEPAREESVFTCPIRQGVKQSESNTMNVFIRGQQKIRRRQCPETVLPLDRQGLAHTLNSAGHITQLANAGRLDQNAVRMIWW